MSVSQEISAALIRDQINRAVAEVFKTMLSFPIEPLAVEARQMTWPPLSPVPAEAVTQVAGTVGFLGDISGLIYFYLDEVFAAHCTAKLLGMDAAELAAAGDEPVNDAVGELTNMVAGVFKNRLCDSGYSCKLTIPSILRGRHFSVDPKKPAQRHTYWFASQGHRVVADILMKIED